MAKYNCPDCGTELKIEIELNNTGRYTKWVSAVCPGCFQCSSRSIRMNTANSNYRDLVIKTLLKLHWGN